MTGMRRLVREMARIQSYRKEGNTDAFMVIFNHIWRRRLKHPANLIGEYRSRKKNMRHGKKKGHGPIFNRIR